jgi:hypothetical protein
MNQSRLFHNDYEDDASVLSNYNHRGHGSAITQRQVLRACKARGWTMHPAALSLILDAVLNDADQGNATILSTYLDHLQPFMQRSHSTVITANIWKELMDERDATSHHSKQPSRSHSTKTPIIQVISAFEMPKLSYDITRQQFQVVPSTKTLLGTAEDKVTPIAMSPINAAFGFFLEHSHRFVAAASFVLDSNTRAAIRAHVSTRHATRALSPGACVDHLRPRRTLEDHGGGKLAREKAKQ